MRWETYNFSDDFQDAIVACLIRQPKEFYGFGRIIRPNFFNGPAAVETVHRIQDYREKYGKQPNFSVLANYAFHIAAKINTDHAKELFEYIEKLAEIDTSDWKGILDLSIRFAQERAIYDVVRKVHSAQSEGKMAEVDPVEMVRQAMAVGRDQNDLGISLYHDSDEVIDRVTKNTYGTMTGFAQFDALWKFGWGPGWLIVPLAPPKCFKTTFCINLALNMASHKVNSDVLYYACEIKQELAMMRALYNISGIGEEQVFRSPEKCKPLIKQHLVRQLYGNIWFKGYASKAVTLSQIRDHARFIIDTYELRPKAIIIDYADTVRPVVTGKNIAAHILQAETYTQARAIGDELNCCVIMPDRCTKETVGKSVPSMKSFQGAFEKAGIVDAAIGICADEAEQQQNRVRYFVFLNRHGEALKHYSGKIDPVLSRMTVDNEIEYNPEDNEDDDDKPKRRRRPTSKEGRQMARLSEATQRD